MFYAFAKKVLWLFARVRNRVRVVGREHIPGDGAFLLCGNHISMLDAPYLAVFCPRQLAFMAKKELFKFRLLGALFRAVGAFPVDRGATDMTAYRHAMDVLKGGKPLLIFSQGTRMKEFDNAKGGVAVFALKAGVPIVPVGISGSYRWFGRVNIRFGAPISMEPYAGRKVKTDVVDEVMEQVVAAVSALAKPS